jgi:hypothetical protein
MNELFTVRARHALFAALSLTTLWSLPARAQIEAEVVPPPGAEPTQAVVAIPTPPPMVASLPAHETICTGRQDEDGDGLPDCADADCYADPSCRAGGSEERSNQACSDWIDNDGDAAVDCDDDDCRVDWVNVCNGSWTGAAASSGGGTDVPMDDLPELGEGMSVEDLIGTGGDLNGERNDETCSDGIDNDSDGRMDCADFGCRFDPQVSVCQGEPGFRFSVVAGIGARINLGFTPDENLVTNSPEAGFTRLQLRALGPIPGINNSFFLVNVEASDSVRLTFLLFQIPLGTDGHYINLNSGSGTLTTGRIVSASRLPLLDPAFYMLNLYEQGNGGVVEVGGPIDSDGLLNFRLFVGGGAGNFTGNVGGARVSPSLAGSSFAWTAGAQLHVNLIGRIDPRYDIGLMYTPETTGFAVRAGAKWDQRPLERQVVWQGMAVFRAWHLSFRAETVGRFAIDYGGAANEAFNFEVQALLIPRTLVLSGDIGGNFRLLDYDRTMLPMDIANDVFVPEEFQYRFALTYYFFRNVGTITALYSENRMSEFAEARFSRQAIERVLRLEARFRF